MGFDKIRALDDRQKSRDKLPIFYGSRDNYTHGFREVALNNTIDEISNNFDNGDVYITLHDDDMTITVEDTGRGLPIDGESDGIPNWELFLTRLFASGKYDLENAFNSGVNGVGSCVLQYTSSLYSVTSYHDNKEYKIEFKNGGELTTPLTYIGKTDKHGTIVTWKLDPECYTRVKYNYKELIDMVLKVSAVSPKVTFHFMYKGNESIFHYDKLIDYYNENIKDSNDSVFECNNKTYEEDVKTEICYTDNENSTNEEIESPTNNTVHEITKIECIFSVENEPKQQAFLNMNYLPLGGTINRGIIEGIKNYCHKYIKANNLYQKKEKIISNDDVSNTISFVVNVLSNNVEYQSQTKFATEKKLYLDVAKRFITEYLEIFEIEQKLDFENLVNKILITKRANEKADASRQAIKKKLSEKVNIFNKIEGLYEAEEKDPNKRILCICEGKSALSSLLSGKREVHAIFPLRGKILNCLKASAEQIFKNDVIVKLYQALNCGMELKDKKNKNFVSFDINNLRYHDIYIMVDADFDGVGSIFPLLLTMFYKLSPTLIKEGRIHLCETPKYEIDFNDNDYYAVDDAELEDVKNKLDYKNNKNKITINYIKGLAELSSTAMGLCLEEGYKNIKTITMEDVDKAREVITLFMDTSVEPRKQYLLEHYNEIDIMED